MTRRLIILVGLTAALIACSPAPSPTPEVAAEEFTPTPPPPTATHTPRPTATPRPVTPMASPTPTITPTPIIYVIQPGDTLLKIAIQFDRPPELIQEVNGIVDPRLLQIGQELVIPPPQANPDTPPTPTPTPPPLFIDALNFVRTPQGALWGLGEVRNPGATALTQVVIEASLFDAGGIVLDRAATFPQLDVVLPDQAVPFALQFDNPPDQFAQYTVTAVSGIPLSPNTRYYFDLQPVDLHGGPEGFNLYRITGQLRNTGASDAESIRLVAVVYDEAGRMLAQRQADLAVSVLKAGAITPFELEVILPEGVVDHFDVLAQGLLVQ
ncbi:MAG: LysM domain-containing protein [Chloroflexi bacterium]|nr:MAG: LysM domain-containing protein [Chloroflexota bacterium]